jgi:hypothetical protein
MDLNQLLEHRHQASRPTARRPSQTAGCRNREIVGVTPALHAAVTSSRPRLQARVYDSARMNTENPRFVPS